METSNQPANSTPSVETGVHFKRPCLAISDLERSLKLYRDILGFRLDYESDADPDSYLYTVFQFPPEAKLRFASLSTEYEPRALAFVEAKEIELPPPPIPQRGTMVIRVPNLEEAIAQIRQLGLETVKSSSFAAPPNLEFTEQGFYDFDGHSILLYGVKSRAD